MFGGHPNIYGETFLAGNEYNGLSYPATTVSGAFEKETTINRPVSTNTSGNADNLTLIFNASSYSDTYVESGKLQASALQALVCIKV